MCSRRYAVYDPDSQLFSYYLSERDAKMMKEQKGAVTVTSTILYADRFAFYTQAGRFYVVCVAENDPASLVSYLRERGLTGETVLRRRARNEALSVLRFVRS